jgi:hypothetical protein
MRKRIPQAFLRSPRALPAGGRCDHAGRNDQGRSEKKRISHNNSVFFSTPWHFLPQSGGVLIFPLLILLFGIKYM